MLTGKRLDSPFGRGAVIAIVSALALTAVMPTEASARARRYHGGGGAAAAAAFAGGYGNDPDRADQPQAQDGRGVSGKPGGHGGGGFGTSDVDHVSPNGHTDPSGTNGNQGSDNNNPRAGNGSRGNAGGLGGGSPE